MSSSLIFSIKIPLNYNDSQPFFAGEIFPKTKSKFLKIENDAILVLSITNLFIFKSLYFYI
jgi:hypothetical protein